MEKDKLYYIRENDLSNAVEISCEYKEKNFIKYRLRAQDNENKTEEIFLGQFAMRTLNQAKRQVIELKELNFFADNDDIEFTIIKQGEGINTTYKVSYIVNRNREIKPAEPIVPRKIINAILELG
jgi:hypothetical protein